MATIGTRLMTWWRGELVGEDQFGNRYYRHKTQPKRRWVIYKGEADGSKTPPEWSAWLHRTVDEAPTGPRRPIVWEKEHLPNLTGTAEAYRPAGSLLEAGRRASATGDYEAWRPD